MKMTELDGGRIKGFEQRIWGGLDESARIVADGVLKSPEYAARCTDFMKNGGFRPNRRQRMAREIMGPRFIGIEEYWQVGYIPTNEQIDALEHIPFTEKTLRNVSYSHALVAVFPISINEMIVRWGTSMFSSFELRLDRKGPDAFKDQRFASKTDRVSWQLISLIGQNRGIGARKGANRFAGCFKSDVTLASAQALAYMSSVNKRLFEMRIKSGHREVLVTDASLVTSDTTNDGAQVIIGPDEFYCSSLGSGGLVIANEKDPLLDRTCPNLRIATAIKPDFLLYKD